MRKLSLRGRKRRGLDEVGVAVKRVITGAAIPKSLSQISLEKNYVMMARMLTGMIDRMQKIEDNMENLENKMLRLLRSRKASS